MKNVIDHNGNERVALELGDEIVIKIKATDEQALVAFGLFINGERVEKCMQHFKLDISLDNYLLEYSSAQLRDGKLICDSNNNPELEHVSMNIMPLTKEFMCKSQAEG